MVEGRQPSPDLAPCDVLLDDPGGHAQNLHLVGNVSRYDGARAHDGVSAHEIRSRMVAPIAM
jgi:hypothetical protein